MNNYFVILAAGKSKRFHKNSSKQFYNYKNKEIIDHSIEKSLNSKLFKKIIIVTNNISQDIDLNNSLSDYERLIQLNKHIDSLFKKIINPNS